MSVLIKGLDMPKLKPNTRVKAEIRLLDGRLEFGIMTGGYRCCEQWQYYQIAEVPTPHGRLIDADIPEDVRQVHGFFNDYDLQELLEAAPTVIEAEE